jgi:hypothetical protein
MLVLPNLLRASSLALWELTLSNQSGGGGWSWLTKVEADGSVLGAEGQLVHCILSGTMLGWLDIMEAMPRLRACLFSM